MVVVAFVRPAVEAALPRVVRVETPERRLRWYGRAMQGCFLAVLVVWVGLEVGCLLSMMLHFQSGIVAGSVDGTVAFRFWPAVDYFSPDHARAFVPQRYGVGVSAAYAGIVVAGSAPFFAALVCLARLFGLYAEGEVFTARTSGMMRWIGHCIMATGYSPLLLGPLAHWIGVLRPVTGVTGAMIAFVVLGAALLAIAHVMEIGQRLRQEQEEIL